MTCVASSKIRVQSKSAPTRPRLHVVAPYAIEPVPTTSAVVSKAFSTELRLVRLMINFEAVPGECLHMLRANMAAALGISLAKLKRTLPNLRAMGLMAPVWWDLWRPPEGRRRTREQSLLAMRRVPKRYLRPASFDSAGRLVASPELIALAEARLAKRARHGGARRGAGRPRKPVEPKQDPTLSYTHVGDASAPPTASTTTPIKPKAVAKPRPKTPAFFQVEPANDSSLCSENQKLLGFAEGETSNLRGAAAPEFFEHVDQPKAAPRPNQPTRLRSTRCGSYVLRNYSHTIPANDCSPAQRPAILAPNTVRPWWDVCLADLEPDPEPTEAFPF